MVKTPKTRHSKSKRDPVTIDLEPSSVSRSADKTSEADKAGEGATKGMESETAKAAPSATTPAGAPKASSEAMKQQPEAPKTTDKPADTATTGKPSEAKAEKPSASSVPPGGGKPSAFGRDAGSSSAAASSTTPGGGSTRSETKPERPRSEPASSSRGGTGSAITGGIVGAILTLLLAGVLQWTGVLPGARTASEDAVAVEGVQQEVAELRTGLNELREAAPAAGGAGGEDMANALQRLDALEETVGTLDSDVAGLKEAVASGEAGEGAGLEALETRLSEIENTVGGLSEGGGVDGADVSGLEERIGALEQNLAGGSDAVQSAASAAEANTGRLSELEDRIAALDERVGSGSENQTARLIAATALKSAVDGGEPFAAELDTYAALAQDGQDVSALRPYAESGVPTRTALAEQASEAASRMISATRISGDQAGFFERLWTSAQALVVVRPVGAPEGEDVPPTVARMESAVQGGDYENALAEYETLPEDAQTAGQDFAERLRARLAADDVVGQAMSDALKAAQG